MGQGNTGLLPITGRIRRHSTGCWVLEFARKIPGSGRWKF